jgi:hypothetical protein
MFCLLWRQRGILKLFLGGIGMEDIWLQVGNYGFPMLVAIYLLVRAERKLDALTAAITRLEQVLSVYLHPPEMGVKTGERESGIAH